MNKIKTIKLNFCATDETKEEYIAKTPFLVNYEIFWTPRGCVGQLIFGRTYHRLTGNKLNLSKKEVIEICQTDFNQRIFECLEDN